MILFFSVLVFAACQEQASEEEKEKIETEEEQVEGMIKEDEARIDSFKRANGLE